MLFTDVGPDLLPAIVYIASLVGDRRKKIVLCEANWVIFILFKYKVKFSF